MTYFEVVARAMAGDNEGAYNRLKLFCRKYDQMSWVGNNAANIQGEMNDESGDHEPYLSDFVAVTASAVNGILGINPTWDKLDVTPHLPKGWRAAKASILYKGVKHEVTVNGEEVTIKPVGRVYGKDKDGKYAGILLTGSSVTGGESTMGTPDLNRELPFRAMIAIYDEPRTNATAVADMWSATPKQIGNEAYWEGKFNTWSRENYNSIIWLGPNELGAAAAGGGQALLALDEFPEAKELPAAESARIITQMRTLFGRAKKKGQNNYLYTHSVWVTPAFAKAHKIDGPLPESDTVSRFHNTQYGPKHYPECGVVNEDTKRYTAGVFAEFASLYKDLDGFYVNIGEALPRGLGSGL